MEWLLQQQEKTLFVTYKTVSRAQIKASLMEDVMITKLGSSALDLDQLKSKVLKIHFRKHL